MIDGQNQGGGDFRAILSAAKDVDGAADAVLTGGEPGKSALVEVIDPSEAWAEIPRKVGSLLAIVAPELRDVYSEEACKGWGRDMHRLATKRGWSAEGLPPEVAAGISTCGLLLPTLVVLKARRDAVRRAQAQPQPQSGESQGTSGAESVGQAV